MTLTQRSRSYIADKGQVHAKRSRSSVSVDSTNINVIYKENVKVMFKRKGHEKVKAVQKSRLYDNNSKGIQTPRSTKGHCHPGLMTL